MGLGSQMILWDDEFCEQLAARGLHVIRFDNRDVGRSTQLRGTRIPKRWQLLIRHSGAAAYSLDDMAQDAVGLLDHLGIPAAHIVGASMGGMIAQLIAINHPDRVLSLVSIMSTTGARRVGRPRPAIARHLMRRGARELDTYIKDHIATYRLIGSQEFDFEEDHKRERAARCFERGVYPAGSARQLGAIVGASDRTERLREIRVPTTVIHGDAGSRARHPAGHGTRSAPGAVAADHRCDRGQRRHPDPGRRVSTAVMLRRA
jgi:pimeloyl-ACP methyl ester carboxylesterase